jgi:hypothetical protein
VFNPPTQPHTKCVTGAALVNMPGCTLAVGTNAAQDNQAIITSVCAADPFCCASGWDSLCVGEVYSVGNSKICPASQGSCAHNLCVTGAALAANCDSAFGDCRDLIVAADSFCGTTSWDSICVNEVTTVCNKNCF